MTTEPDTDSDAALRRHRALADPSRRRILATLASRGPLGVRELAEQAGLHVNTVRAHVGRLVAAGLCEALPGPAGERGRPRSLFRALAPSDDAPGVGAGGDTGDERFRLLAEILAATFDQADIAPPPTLARVAQAWGRHLVEEPPPFQPRDDQTAFDELVRLLEQLGFGPRLVAGEDGSVLRIEMTPCPFLELAQRHPDVVCPVHLGLMRGALTKLDSDATVTELVPFATPATCVAHIAPASS